MRYDRRPWLSLFFLCTAASCTSAEPRADGSVCGCIDTALSWSSVGGFRAFDSTDEVSACRAFTYTQTSLSDGSSESCTNEVPCADNGVTIADLDTALAHPDVVAAFAAAPVLYGRDTRPVDGSLLLITQSERTFSVGAPCLTDPACTPIPAGVTALVEVLYTLHEERLAEEDCASTFP